MKLILTIPLSETKGKRSNLHINVFLIEHKKDFTQQNLITICFFLLLSNYLPVLKVTLFSLHYLYYDDFFPYLADFLYLAQSGGIFNQLPRLPTIRAPCESIHFSIFFLFFCVFFLLFKIITDLYNHMIIRYDKSVCICVLSHAKYKNYFYCNSTWYLNVHIYLSSKSF